MLALSEVNRRAVGGRTQAVRRWLKRLGMRRCSARLVQYQFKPDATRHDWTSLWWRWFLAVWFANKAGAYFMFEQFAARVDALREMEGRDARDVLELFGPGGRDEDEGGGAEGSADARSPMAA